MIYNKKIMTKKMPTMQQLQSLCKRRGFVSQGSEIYGGFGNTYSYGPYGSQMKKNIKDLCGKTLLKTDKILWE